MARIAPGTRLSVADLASLIDHALLAPDLTPDDVLRGVDAVAAEPLAGLCVRPIDVARVVAHVAGTGRVVGTVIGFPHGATTTVAKVAEAKQALLDGARELDMVLPIGLLRAGDVEGVTRDIAAVVDAAAGTGDAGGRAVVAGGRAVVKVIFETALLDDGEKVDACRAASDAGADYVKTSTGFASVPTGATVADVLLMAANVPDRMGVKASGGIRDLERVLQLVGAGATRIGCSSTTTILAAARGVVDASSEGALVVPEPARELT